MGRSAAIAGPPERVRVQIEMSSRALDQLDELVLSTDASSRAEVLRNALKVYGWLVDQRQEYEISLLKKKDDQEFEVALLEVGL